MVSRTVKAGTSWNARDLRVSARTRATLPLFWGVADAFRRDPQGWELSHARFELRRSIEIAGMRWVMSARVGSSIGPLESGAGPRGRLLSLPYVHLWGPRITRAERRRLARRGAYDRVAGVFTEHGYTVGWGEELGRKLLWAHPWPHAPGVGPLSDQRRWLEQVFVADGRRRPHRAAGLSNESLWSVLDSFRDDRAGPWLPVVFEFNTTRSLALRGSAVGAPRLVVRVDRWDMGGLWHGAEPWRASMSSSSCAVERRTGIAFADAGGSPRRRHGFSGRASAANGSGTATSSR